MSILKLECLHFLFFNSISTEIKHNDLVAKYHPNVWMDGKWRCCQQTEKMAAGCHIYDPLGNGLFCLFSFSVQSSHEFGQVLSLLDVCGSP